MTVFRRRIAANRVDLTVVGAGKTATIDATPRKIATCRQNRRAFIDREKLHGVSAVCGTIREGDAILSCSSAGKARDEAGTHEAGTHEGCLARAVSEHGPDTDAPPVTQKKASGRITPGLALGADVTRLRRLGANASTPSERIGSRPSPT